jgi:hypothetical protein
MYAELPTQPLPAMQARLRQVFEEPPINSSDGLMGTNGDATPVARLALRYSLPHKLVQQAGAPRRLWVVYRCAAAVVAAAGATAAVSTVPEAQRRMHWLAVMRRAWATPHKETHIPHRDPLWVIS